MGLLDCGRPLIVFHLIMTSISNPHEIAAFIVQAETVQCFQLSTPPTLYRCLGNKRLQFGVARKKVTTRLGA